MPISFSVLKVVHALATTVSSISSGFHIVAFPCTVSATRHDTEFQASAYSPHATLVIAAYGLQDLRNKHRDPKTNSNPIPFVSRSPLEKAFVLFLGAIAALAVCSAA